MASRMPSLYIPHGAGPCFFMDWDPPDLWKPMGDFLKSIAASLPDRPKAILLVSAHWETSCFTVGACQSPALIFDYYGFPPHTYELSYPAPGDLALANRAVALLQGAGLDATADASRGFDHGVFIPLKLVFPNADIPVIPLSLRHDHDPGAHLAAGRALSCLRDEGVLIVGSGMSFHNMLAFRNPASLPDAPLHAAAFSDWLNGTIALPRVDRDAALTRWQAAPHALIAHPPRAQEHLLPLLLAAGAAADDVGRSIFDQRALGMRITGYRFG